MLKLWISPSLPAFSNVISSKFDDWVHREDVTGTTCLSFFFAQTAEGRKLERGCFPNEDSKRPLWLDAVSNFLESLVPELKAPAPMAPLVWYSSLSWEEISWSFLLHSTRTPECCRTRKKLSNWNLQITKQGKHQSKISEQRNWSPSLIPGLQIARPVLN